MNWERKRKFEFFESARNSASLIVEWLAWTWSGAFKIAEKFQLKADQIEAKKVGLAWGTSVAQPYGLPRRALRWTKVFYNNKLIKYVIKILVFILLFQKYKAKRTWWLLKQQNNVPELKNCYQGRSHGHYMFGLALCSGFRKLYIT